MQFFEEKDAMEDTERVVLSVRDKILVLMCSFGLILIIAALFSLILIPFVSATVWPTSLKLIFVGVCLVWLSVILDKVGHK